MSGYHYECPSCDTIHDFDPRPQPLVWFDPERIDPADIQRVLDGQQTILPSLSGEGSGITYTPPELPDRQCRACGQDGCLDCLPNEVCSTCAHDPEYTGLDYACPGCGECGGQGVTEG